jgi:hypothetical protein
MAYHAAEKKGLRIGISIIQVKEIWSKDKPYMALDQERT